MRRRIKQLISVILVLTLLLGISPVSAFALENEDVQQNTSEEFQFIESVTKMEPSGATPIRSAKDLDKIRENLNGVYYLTNDIDVSGYENWIPIGSDASNPFLGTLYGNGYQIQNLTINSSYTGDVYFGLFGYVGNTSFAGQKIFAQDLMLSNLTYNITSSNDVYVGGIAGAGTAKWASYCFTNCVIEGNITVNTTANANVGGCLGGGRAARIWSDSNRTDISVVAKETYVGGLVGSCSQTSVQNSNNLGNINATTTEGIASTGGLCGSYEGSSGKALGAGVIDSCFNDGVVKSMSDTWYSYAGGLVGLLTAVFHNPVITNCYNSNSIYAITSNPSATLIDGSAASCGAFAGKVSNGANNSILVDCFYNVGRLSAQNGPSASGATGNLVGWIYRGWSSNDFTFSNCYSMDYGYELAGLVTDASWYNMGKIVKTSVSVFPYSQMFEQSIYTGFDFEKTWGCFNDSTYSYPQLQENRNLNTVLTKAELTEEEYILAHEEFATKTLMPENFGFYNYLWSEENGSRLFALKTWDVLGDIGKVFTFQFDDLAITADYYDLFLSDLILKYNEQIVNDSSDLQFVKTSNSIYKNFKNILASSDEWEKNVIDGSTIDLEIDGFLVDPNYHLSDGTYNALKLIFQDLFTDDIDEFVKIYDKAESTFKKLNVASQIFEYVSDATDIVNAFREAYKAYIVAKLYKDANQEFFNILYSAVDQMRNEQYSQWFKKALDKYYNISLDDQAIYEGCLSMMKDTGYMTYNLLLKPAIENIAYRIVAKCLNITVGQLAQVVKVLTGTYNVTYVLLDAVMGIGQRATPYYIMNYVAYVEEALCKVENDYACSLIRNTNLENALKYDEAYGVLRCVNMYLYQCAYDFSSVKNHINDMEMSILLSDIWNKNKCHHGALIESNSKYTSIQCPVDVSVYDSNGKLLLSIVNEKITTCDTSITALVFDGKKSIVYSADKDYQIRITARESGKMNYYISEVEHNVVTRQLKFYDIPLAEEIEYTAQLPKELEISNSEYALSSEKDVINCDYDSLENLCLDGHHAYGDWELEKDAGTCQDGIRVRSCVVCGNKEYDLVPGKHLHTEFSGGYEATCTHEGYEGNIVCSDCGELIDKGNVIPVDEHDCNDWTIIKEPTCIEEGQKVRSCGKCGMMFTESVPKLAHQADENNWVIIQQPTNTAEGLKVLKCKYCGAVLQEKPVLPLVITVNGEAVKDDVAFVKLPSVFMLYKNHSATLGFTLDPSIEVQNVKWSYANWSESSPEATIESPNDLETVIRPNGKGIGARSTWVTLTVTDVDGNIYNNTIKVRFYKWNWQRW